MMDSDRERWKDDLLATLGEAGPVAPDPFLLGRIEARLGTPRAVPRLALGVAGAGLALLLLLDLGAVLARPSRETPAPDASRLLADFNLYDR
ncbi:MAG: hypothetical protein R2882_13515 [Gemmatimonadales bacterium]